MQMQNKPPQDAFEAALELLETHPGLSMLMLEPPITIHRSLIELTGAATSALFLGTLCTSNGSGDWGGFIEHSEAERQESWLIYSPEEMQLASGLSRKEQTVARKHLIGKRLIEEKSRQGKQTYPLIRVNHLQIQRELIVLANRTAQPSNMPTYH